MTTKRQKYTGICQDVGGNHIQVHANHRKTAAAYTNIPAPDLTWENQTGATMSWRHVSPSSQPIKSNKEGKGKRNIQEINQSKAI